MEKFEVIIEKTAMKDFEDIAHYISEILLEPSTANKILNEIRDGIFSLETMPTRFPIIDEQPFFSFGIRKFNVKNYMIFYVIDKNKKIVKVFRILYSRRYWKNIV